MTTMRKEEKRTIALAAFSEAEGEQEGGTHQPLSPGSMPAGPCP